MIAHLQWLADLRRGMASLLCRTGDASLLLKEPPRTPEGMRLYAVGDIHGQLDLFERLIERVAEDDGERPAALKRLIILGDFIDRGEKSASLARLLMRFDKASRSVIVLRGNHEQTLIDILRGDYDALNFWLEHGGRTSIRSWGVDEALTEPFRERELMMVLRAVIGKPMRRWLEQLPLFVRLGDYLFVHAGIRPGIPIARQKAEDLLWIRDDFLSYQGLHPATIVHGHSVVEEGPVFAGNRIGVDTGAYRTGRLCAVGLEGYAQWQVST